MSDWEIGLGGGGVFEQSQTEFADFIETDEFADVVDAPLFMPVLVLSRNGMNEVAGSQTARDEIKASDLAYSEVQTSNMAIGKWVVWPAGLDPADYDDMNEVSASQTAMNEVSASQTAMNEVAASQTAMNEVVESIIARTSLLSSSFVRDTVWTEDVASGKIWDAGDFGPVTDGSISTVAGRTGEGQAIEIHVDSGDNTKRSEGWSHTYDFDNADTLRVYTKHEDIGQNGRDDRFGLDILLNGDELLRVSPSHDWTERTLDVSAHSGELTLELNTQVNENIADEWKVWFDEIQFE